MLIPTEPLERPSSLLAEVGYDPDTKTLAVKFHAGKTYHYHPVSEHEFEALKVQGGQYFHKHIKPKGGAPQ